MHDKALIGSRVVPKFFFDTLEGSRRDCDSEGLELVDERSARRMAWTCLAEVLADMREPPDAPIVILVSDHLRRPIYEVVAGGECVASAAPASEGS